MSNTQILNYHNNTEGCLMPGKTYGESSTNYHVSNSKKALDEIFSEIDGYSTIKMVISNQLEITN